MSDPTEPEIFQTDEELNDHGDTLKALGLKEKPTDTLEAVVQKIMEIRHEMANKGDRR